LPAIALGMLMRITGGSSRRVPLGEAIAGLGLFFLGLDILGQTFGALGETVSLDAFARTGILGLLLFIFIGFLLTTLMQSSSAALAVTITAAAGGVIPLHPAACLVLGAILGTCTTAAFASLGATSEGRRAALSHVSLNSLTMLVGFVALPVLLPLAQGLTAVLTGGPNIAVTLAFFHTSVVILGVAAIWPLTGRLVRRLEGMFARQDADETRPRYLDDNVLKTPVMAVDALVLEVRRVGRKSRRMLASVLADSPVDEDQLWQTRKEVNTLGAAIIRFGSQLGRHGGTDREIEERVYGALRITDYYLDVAERAIYIHQVSPLARIRDTAAAAEHQAYLQAVGAYMEEANPLEAEYDRERAEHGLHALDEMYHALKERLLRLGALGRIEPEQLSAVLERISAVHRATDQLYKVGRYAESLSPGVRQVEQAEAAT
jgi:phosphate:Na+ symporter